MASQFNSLPSEIIDEGHELPPIARYSINKAVNFFGTAIENALAEMVEVGIKPNIEHKPKYTLSQLLDKDFRLPRPATTQAKSRKVGEQVKALFGGTAPKRKGKAPPVSPLMRKWLERHGGKAA